MRRFRVGPVSLRTRILLVAVGAVLLLGLATTLFVRANLERMLVSQLASRGLSLGRHLAASAVDPLLTERFLDLELMLHETLRDEPDLEYLFILSPRGDVLAHTFAGGFPVALKTRSRSASAVRQLDTGSGTVLDVSAPLLGGNLGVLHLGLTEHALRRDVRATVHAIAWIVAGCTLVAALLAIWLEVRLAEPLERLADAADHVRAGRLPAPLPTGDDDEVGRLAAAFNTLVAGRRGVDAQQLRLVAELEATRASVRHLQGLLPICPGCRLIRDDREYLAQIEAYLGDHTEALFSHSLCPDCLKKLYPEAAGAAQP